FLHVRLGVHEGPLAGGYGYLCERLAGAVFAVLVHVAAAGHRVVDGRADEAVGGLELGAGKARAAEAGSIALAGAASRLAVRHESDAAVAGVDRSDGVSDVDDEGRPTDGGGVGELRPHTDVLADREGRVTGREQAIDVLNTQPCVCEGVMG